MSAIDEVRERIDIVELIGAHVPLKKAGKSYKGCCPFHQEKTPSFYVYPDNWSYHCFGCQAHGDGFVFVEQTERVDFKEALSILADRAGVRLPDPRQRDPEVDEARERILAVNEAAAQYFSHLLLNSSAGKAAREYLAGRHVGRASIDTFRLGYSLPEWNALERYLLDKGHRPEDVRASGLVVVREEENRTYDRFRNRVIFPIRDRDGRVVAFGGRALDDSKPKYLNSSESPVFDKGGTLYAFDQARDAIRREDLAVVVEGYMDALIAHQAGYKNVVATMGTALSERHIQALKRLSKGLALALDPDAAGDEATLRGLEVARQSYDERTAPVVSWNGLVRFQGTLDANIRIIQLPQGLDPDELILQDPEAWQRLVDAALPVLDYLFVALPPRYDLRDPQGKAGLRDRLVPLLQELPDAVVRHHYLDKLATLLGVRDASWLQAGPGGRPAKRPAQRNGAKAPEAARPAGEAAPARPGPTSAAQRLEDYVLALLLQHANLRPFAAKLEPGYLNLPGHRQLFLAWRDQADGQLRAELPDDLVELYDRLRRYPLPALDLAQLPRAWIDCQEHLERQWLKARDLARSAALAAATPQEQESLLTTALADHGRRRALDQARAHRRPADVLSEEELDDLGL